jgi:hypothetical protein
MRQLTDYSMPGLNGPYFPPGLIRGLCLAVDVLACRQSDYFVLEGVARRIQGDATVYMTDIASPGGDRWFWIMRFKTSSGEVHVALPCAQDWSYGDGVMLSFSPAVYTSGTVSDDELAAVVTALIGALPSC